MEDLRDDLYAAIARAEADFATDVTAAMFKREKAVTDAIAADKHSFDLRMAAFNGLTPVKDPVIRSLPHIDMAALEAELDPLPRVVTHRVNGEPYGRSP
jgi:hypothetical protein